MIWIKYLLEANLYMALFFVAYYLLLRRDTHYQLNRAYLLITTLLAFAIPFLELGILKPTMEIIEPVITTQADLSAGIPDYPIVITDSAVNVQQPAEPINYYLWGYVTVGVLMAIGLIFRISQLIRLARKGQAEKVGKISMIRLKDDDHAFSFFNYLFISHKLAASDTIIRHEMVHIRQKHSWDIMYIELLKIVCWFNPTIYFIQHSIKEQHEYIVDRTLASEKDDVDRYTDFLIRNAYGLPAIAPANNFFTKNLLKNRIMMLHQKRSGSLARLKYLVALPLAGGMLCLSTLGFTKDHPVYDIAPKATTITDNGPSAPELNTADQQTKKDTLQVPPKPKVDQVRFPAPKPKVDQVRFPPKPPKPKVDQVRFPPPVMLYAPYSQLRLFIRKNAIYPKIAAEQKLSGTVNLSFNLDASGMIRDVKVAQGAGSGLDEEAIRLLKAYKKPIADKTGDRVIAISFVTDGGDGNAMASAATRDIKGFVGEVMIYSKTFRFPPPVVKPDPKAPAKLGKVTIRGIGSSTFLEPTSPIYIVDGVRLTQENISEYGYKDNGREQSFLSLIPQEDIASMEILREEAAIAQYGPDGRNGVILITTHSGKAKKQGALKPEEQAAMKALLLYAERTVRYPSKAREELKMGTVVAKFNVNDDNTLSNVQITNGIMPEMDNEILRVLKGATVGNGLRKDVTYRLPVYFSVMGEGIGDVVETPPISYTQDNSKDRPTVVTMDKMIVRGYVRRTRQ